MLGNKGTARAVRTLHEKQGAVNLRICGQLVLRRLSPSAALKLTRVTASSKSRGAGPRSTPSMRRSYCTEIHGRSWAMADRFGLPVAVCGASATPDEVTLVAPTHGSRFVDALPERLIRDCA